MNLLERRKKVEDEFWGVKKELDMIENRKKQLEDRLQQLVGKREAYEEN